MACRNWRWNCEEQNIKSIFGPSNIKTSKDKPLVFFYLVSWSNSAIFSDSQHNGCNLEGIVKKFRQHVTLVERNISDDIWFTPETPLKEHCSVILPSYGRTFYSSYNRGFAGVHRSLWTELVRHDVHRFLLQFTDPVRALFSWDQARTDMLNGARTNQHIWATLLKTENLLNIFK
jgi:hypothetical protein